MHSLTLPDRGRPSHGSWLDPPALGLLLDRAWADGMNQPYYLGVPTHFISQRIQRMNELILWGWLWMNQGFVWVRRWHLIIWYNILGELYKKKKQAAKNNYGMQDDASWNWGVSSGKHGDSSQFGCPLGDRPFPNWPFHDSKPLPFPPLESLYSKLGQFKLGWSQQYGANLWLVNVFPKHWSGQFYHIS